MNFIVIDRLEDLVQQTSLPNQWQIEVSNWFSTGLAKEQFWAVEWATQPRNFPDTPISQDPGWKYTPPSNATQLNQCKNQMMQLSSSTEHQSFSILGLSVIFVVGSAIIIVSLTVESVVGWFHDRFDGWGRYKKEQWEAEETLALHQAAYTGLGLWRDDEQDMPPSSALIPAEMLGEELGK